MKIKYKCSTLTGTHLVISPSLYRINPEATLRCLNAGFSQKSGSSSSMPPVRMIVVTHIIRPIIVHSFIVRLHYLAIGNAGWGPSLRDWYRLHRRLRNRMHQCYVMSWRKLMAMICRIKRARSTGAVRWVWCLGSFFESVTISRPTIFFWYLSEILYLTILFCVTYTCLKSKKDFEWTEKNCHDSVRTPLDSGEMGSLR